MRRDLPRPSTVDASLGQARETDTAAGVADGLVRAEMVMLMNHDAAKYPIKKPGAKKEKKVRRTGGEQAKSTLAKSIKILIKF